MTPVFPEEVKMLEKENKKSSKRLWSTLITLSVIVLLLAVAFTLLPRSLPTDFSVVGKGINAVVQMYDPNVLRSTETASAINKVRDDYIGQLEFVVVQIGTPTGRRLSQTYGIDTAALLFFDGNGKILNILQSSQDAKSLRHNFKVIFKLE